MASVMTEIATLLVIVIGVVQGAQDLEIKYEESVNAAVGQNISLPCLISSNHKINFNQFEWRKEGESRTQKLVVFNPLFSPYYYVNVTLQLVNEAYPKHQNGSILHLHNVTREDTGNYICEITTFPSGSFKRTTKVQVTDPQISLKVVSPNGSLIEGDEVKITCDTHPLADGYRLSLKSNFSLESQSGQFTIENVTRNNSDLICRPLWTSSNQHLQSLRASVQLTVDFLDSIECNSSSLIEVEMGTNLTIPCVAKSSRSLDYIWIKGNLTVSQTATISLWSVNPEHSGKYSVIVHARNSSRLWRQRDFLVTVLNRTHAEHQSSTITMETTSLITDGTTLTTAELDTLAVTSQRDHTRSTTYSTATENGQYGNTTVPSAGTTTTSHANVTAAHADESSSAASSLYTSAEGSTQSVACCQWQTVTSSPGPTREGFSHGHPKATNARTTIFMFTLTKQNILKSGAFTVKTEQDERGSKTHVVYVLIPFILLLVLIGFLYRRYTIQKRMDMPPPFKPPPPPVKYTSVRSQDIPVTDILV